MARRKRSSPTLTKALVRAASLQAISPTLDLGSGLNLAVYQTKINEVQNKLNAYNGKLAELDAMLNDLQASEEQLNELNVRLLAGVGAIYGKDSSQYEQAGGRRSSEIVRRPSISTPPS